MNRIIWCSIELNSWLNCSDEYARDVSLVWVKFQHRKLSSQFLEEKKSVLTWQRIEARTDNAVCFIENWLACNTLFSAPKLTIGNVFTKISIEACVLFLIIPSLSITKEVKVLINHLE